MIGNRLSVLLESLRAAVGTGLDAVHTRVQLFGNDLEQELLHTCSLIIQSLTTLLLASLAVGFIGLAVIVVFWDSHRVLAAALVATFFVLLTAVAAIFLKWTLAGRPQPFHSTLEVLKRDIEVLRSGS
jgi:uncharacterized membrane protein YqjE